MNWSRRHSAICLGISPPSLKGRGNKEAHEPGQVQDLKPKTTKKKLKKIQKMISETSQNGSQNLSKFPLGGLLGRSWGLLSGSWALLEHILKKTLKKIHLLNVNLGPKIHQKSKKNQRRENTCVKVRFCIGFSSLLHRCWILKTTIFEPIFAITPKMSNL